jgi:adenylate kinase
MTQAQGKKTYKIVFLGPPAVGKGTQAIKMQEKVGAKQLSSGDILREVVAAGGEVGQTLKSIMDKGHLVPDELICRLIAERITDACKQKGFILDGFPRTVSQAQTLDKLLTENAVDIDAVLAMEVDDEVLIGRCLGRLVHPASGRTYHVEFNPPKVPMCDDVTGEPLIRRSDDNESTLRARLNTYHQQTKPIIEYYAKKGLLHRIDASAPADQVWAAIDSIISKI